ncbi:short-chain dehydrogenase, partial [Nocardia cyriacigeorgica]|nr:short-chain dehydrogenase [Nocardia cyriacigeorgica]
MESLVEGEGSTGRTFVVTGANGGLGVETTKVLASKG